MAIPAAQFCFDISDALARFDGRGTGHGTQNGFLAWRLMHALTGHEMPDSEGMFHFTAWA
ncbi:hypothetical protein [Castellaniella defragrans]|jgi:hypothetical protein|uniref:Uncharacterized protein n=1 Tax=Castellaniella defragrans TaxID=75697 RepID=A0A7W9TNF2_CASDE|nr:hypothetical protein [Castellaniella defragrans]MBB6083829.1 hypothetical protein [Castellaniella defragrans]